MSEWDVSNIGPESPQDAWAPIKVHTPGAWDVQKINSKDSEDWISKTVSKVQPVIAKAQELLDKPIPRAAMQTMNVLGLPNSIDPASQAADAVKGILPNGIVDSALQKGKELYSKVDYPSMVGEKVTEKLKEKGVTRGYAGAAGLAANMAVDPLTIIGAGSFLKQAGKIGALTRAGELAADKASGSIVARTGEELVPEVLDAVKTGDINKLNELVESGKTHIFYSEALKQDISKTKDLAGQVDFLSGKKASLEGGTSTPLSARGNVLKLQKTQDDFGAFLAEPQNTSNVDRLISKRDKLSQKNFSSPSYENEASLKRLNKEIQSAIKSNDADRVEAISEYRQKIADTQKALENQRSALVQDISNKIVKKEAQIEKAKAGISKTLSSPVEEDLVKGMLGVTNDKSLFSKEIRSSMQGLTFIADTLDKYSGGAFTRYVINPQIEAEAKWDAARTSAINSMKEIQEKNAIPSDQSQNLRMFIENKAPAPAGLEGVFSSAKKDYGEVMRNAGNKYNEISEKYGLPKVDMSRFSNDDYVFNTKRTNALFDLNDMDIRDVPKDAMFVKHNDLVPESVKHRYDAIPEESLEGAFEAGEKYLANVGKVEAYGGMIKKYRALARTARTLDRPTLAKQFDGLADRLTGDSAKSSIVGADKSTGGFATNTKMKAVATMAGLFSKNAVNSAGAALGNIGSMVSNAIYMGPMRATQSVIDGLGKNLFEHAYRSFVDPSYQLMARKYSKVIPIHSFEPPLRFAERNAPKAVQTARLYQNVVESFRAYMNESMNIGTWNQTFKAARASGYSFDQAVKTADNIVMRTQAMYREAFRPSIVGAGSPFGKLLAPLSTYVFNAANALGQDVLIGELSMRQKVQTLAGAWTAGVLANVITQTLANKPKVNTADFLPFYRQVQYGVGGPLGLLGDTTKDIKGGKYGRAALRAFSYGTPMGSAQIMNTVQGAQSILQGKTQGIIPSTQALVFGPASGKYPK